MAITANEGNFIIGNKKSGNYTLEISLIGYRKLLRILLLNQPKQL